MLKKVIEFSNNVFIITSKYSFREYYYVTINLKLTFETEEIMLSYVDIECEITLMNRVQRL